MNNNSYICRFIAEHPEDWERKLRKEYGINIKKEKNYRIFNYNPSCDFSDPTVQEARGIIIDADTKEVICWPFRKFSNYTDGYADTIDWESACVQEKIDGSIIKLWYDGKEEKWQFSTNAFIRAENAEVEDHSGLSYATLIKQADNYSAIPFDYLHKEYTYIFELVSPETQIIVKYPRASLFHIGTRNNVTGKELDTDIGIKKPRSYPLSSLDECIKAARQLNRSSMTESEPREILFEGFVAVDGHYNRIKIKSPDYIIKHRLRNTKSISKHTCIAMLLKDKDSASQLCEYAPRFKPLFEYYQEKLTELKAQAEQIASFARKLHAECGNDKDALSDVISKHKLAIIGFRAIACDHSGEEILFSLPIYKLARLIPE